MTSFLLKNKGIRERLKNSCAAVPCLCLKFNCIFLLRFLEKKFRETINYYFIYFLFYFLYYEYKGNGINFESLFITLVSALDLEKLISEVGFTRNRTRDSHLAPIATKEMEVIADDACRFELTLLPNTDLKSVR